VVKTVLEIAWPFPCRSPGGGRSHGWFDAAVHVTVPGPTCVSLTNCVPVALVNAAPLSTAEKTTDARSSVIVGPNPLWVIVNIVPASTIVPVRVALLVFGATV
jgi:hypothetical protein